MGELKKKMIHRSTVLPLPEKEVGNGSGKKEGKGELFYSSECQLKRIEEMIE